MSIPSSRGSGSHPSAYQLETAERLLTASVERHEDQIRLDITWLFDSLDVDSEHSHRSGNGFIDIYVPQRRLIAESMAGNAAEDPDTLSVA